MELLKKQFASLIEDIDNDITLLANTSAFLYHNMEDVSWAGFYLYDWEKLILGPFQGKVACTKIPLGKGVCGTAAKTKTTQLVEDVHTFAGHIACDCASNSEIVVPIMVDGMLYGVLDLDSTSFARFTKKDADFLEYVVHLLSEKLKDL